MRRRIIFLSILAVMLSFLAVAGHTLPSSLARQMFSAPESELLPVGSRGSSAVKRSPTSLVIEPVEQNE